MKVGILGGGQLARMLAISAHQLGIEIVCIDPKSECSAHDVTEVVSVDYSDIQAIEKCFAEVDCVTYETENLPFKAVEALSAKFKILPSVDVLKIFQDRLHEKNYLTSLNVPTVQYVDVENWHDVEKAIEVVGLPLLIKTRCSGYDGKGQVLIHNHNEAETAWQNFSGQQMIIEKFVNFDYEISIISVRNKHGDIAFYPITLNQHRNGILHISRAPYLNEKLEKLAKKYATVITQELNYIGVMAIEFFCLDDELMVNEIAPRVHNSGHWTIEGAETSQFENHLRAIVDLPLGATHARGHSTMINFIGKRQDIESLLSISGAHYHWYNKKPLAGRKLGHLTLCAPDKNQLEINTKNAIGLINY